MRSLAIAAAAIVALLVLATPDGMLWGDEGVKLAQTQSLLARGFASDALVYPGEAIDPSWSHFPFFEPHVISREGRRYGIYSPIFAASGAPGWMFGGYRGTLILPAFGALAAALLAAALARRAGAGRPGVWLAGLGTLLLVPIGAYGATFSEHSLAVALVLGAVLLVETTAGRSRLAPLAGGGLCLGLAAVLRPELLAFAPAFVLFVLLRHGPSRAAARVLLVAGGAAGVVLGLHAVLSLLSVGSWSTAVLANHARRTSILQGLPLLVPGGFRFPLLAKWELLLTVLGVAAAAPLARTRIGGLWLVALGAVLLAWCALCLLGVREVLADRQRSLVGLFSTPVLLLGAVEAARAPRSLPGAAALAALLGVALVFATNLDRDAGGLQLGARHMLVAAPLLLVGAIAAMRELPALRLIAAPLLLVSVVSGAAHLRCLVRLKRFHGDVAAEVFGKGLPHVVGTYFWTGQVLAAGFSDHQIFVEPDAALLQRMRDAGVDRFVQTLGGVEPGQYRDLGVEAVDERHAPRTVVLRFIR